VLPSTPFCALTHSRLVSPFLFQPVTIATVLDFTDPVWTALLALYMLGEPISVWHAAAVLLCLTGSFLVTQPAGVFSDAEPINGWGVVLGLGGAVTGALSYIAMRKLQTSEPTNVLVFYLSLVCALISIGPMIVLNQYPTAALDWFLLLLIGVLAYCGQMLQTYGFQTTPAALASALNYVQLILTTVLAIVLYAEIPNAYTIIGCLLIVASTIALILAQRKKPSITLPAASDASTHPQSPSSPSIELHLSTPVETPLTDTSRLASSPS
jgi:drug/metabolite transporter (DMT)-like permease